MYWRNSWYIKKYTYTFVASTHASAPSQHLTFIWREDKEIHTEYRKLWNCSNPPQKGVNNKKRKIFLQIFNIWKFPREFNIRNKFIYCQFTTILICFFSSSFVTISISLKTSTSFKLWQNHKAHHRHNIWTKLNWAACVKNKKSLIEVSCARTRTLDGGTLFAHNLVSDQVLFFFWTPI